MKDGGLLIHSLASFNSFTVDSSLFQNGTNHFSKMVNVINSVLSKKLKSLCSLDHLILFKFHQLVVKIFIKELQIVF